MTSANTTTRSALEKKLLVPGRVPNSQNNLINPIQVQEMAMILTLDELMPNPDNPRTNKNPKYEEIKDSIRSRGLDTVPKVTKDPEDPNGKFIFSDGGNTRYSVLRELWQETLDDRFYRIQCIVKPWPGRLKCLIGHLTENDMRGELSFIEKALGIEKAKKIHEKNLGVSISQRQLIELLNLEGYPVHQSNVSLMFQTIEYLYPYIPNLLNNGLGRPKIVSILNLRSNVLNALASLCVQQNCEEFDSVFNNVCSELDTPCDFSLDVFKEHLIDALISTFTELNMTYDQWLIAIDRDKFNAVDLHDFKPITNVQSVPSIVTTTHNDHQHNQQDEKKETQLNLPGAQDNHDLQVISPAVTHYEDDVTYDDENHDDSVIDITSTSTQPSQDQTNQTHERQDYGAELPQNSIDPFLDHGIEKINPLDIWTIPYLENDLDHLLAISYRLAFDILESESNDTKILIQISNENSIGFDVSRTSHWESWADWFLSCLVKNFSIDINDLFFGSESTPPFVQDDLIILKCFRLIRVIRRIREIQRNGGFSE